MIICVYVWCLEFPHHDDTALTQFMRSIADRFPLITRLTSIGKSVENRDLWVIEISDQPGIHEPGMRSHLLNHVPTSTAVDLGLS